VSVGDRELAGMERADAVTITGLLPKAALHIA
jgi:hypothetical protein